jgi:hypothetical protein
VKTDYYSGPAVNPDTPVNESQRYTLDVDTLEHVGYTRRSVKCEQLLIVAGADKPVPTIPFEILGQV